MKKELLIGVCLSIIPAISNADPYTCAELGYVYIPEGCPSESFMARCPMNLDLVWCAGGEMCGKYPVKGEACHEGARVEICPQTTDVVFQANKRCKYENESCNKCWSKGVYSSGTGCGTTASCCKDGWDWNAATGKCVIHECDPIKYPYTTDDNAYADYAGEVQTCKSGNTIHFGYKHGSCKSMWQHESENSGEAGYYKCVCQRDNYEKGYVFPFDKSTYFSTFGKGAYGDSTMCSDAEGSYYGYTHCFRGWEMVKSGGNRTGQCSDPYSYYANVTYDHPTNISNDTSLYSQYKTIANNGYKCIYEGACTPETQKYEECNICMAADGMKNGKSIVKLYAFRGQYTAGLVDGCFDDDAEFMGNKFSSFGMCYRECQWGSSDCKLYDAVIKNGQPLGIVVQVNSNNRIIAGFQPNNSYTWEEAKAYVASYTPSITACPAGSGCEAGKWNLPNSSSQLTLLNRTRIYFLFAIYKYAALTHTGDQNNFTFNSSNIWSTVESGNTAYVTSAWDAGYLLKNYSGSAIPLLTMEVK